jgi:hypothetical protein
MAVEERQVAEAKMTKIVFKARVSMIHRIA